MVHQLFVILQGPCPHNLQGHAGLLLRPAVIVISGHPHWSAVASGHSKAPVTVLHEPDLTSCYLIDRRQQRCQCQTSCPKSRFHPVHKR